MSIKIPTIAMAAILAAAFVLAAAPARAATVTSIDFVVVKDGRVEEAIYYYRNNWAEHRTKALAAGHIRGFRLLIDRSDGSDTMLLLITDYESTDQFEAREENFAPIIEAAGGRKLLNDVQPAEFREVVEGRDFETL